MQTIYFMSGLPRSGSTLLQNVLAQNSALYPTTTSGLYKVIYQLRQVWDQVPEHKALDFLESQHKKLNTFKAVLQNYHGVTDRIIIDKARPWLQEIKLLEALLERPVKILVTIRDMRDVLASWENLQRSNPTMYNQLHQNFYPQSLTVEGRLQIYMQNTQPIGQAFSFIRDAVLQGYKDRLFFIHYEELTNNPSKILSDIHEFLNLPNFEYDITNVTQVLQENDARAYGIPGLHQIQEGPILPAKPKWPDILGRAVDRYRVNWYEVINGV